MTTILIADDVQVIRQALRVDIESHYDDINVLEAENGQQGMEIAGRHDIDILITDIRMPVCDGIEFIGRLRNELSFDKPIIVLSGFNEFEYAQKALRMGVIDYILKPVEKIKLFETLDNAFHIMGRQQSIHHLQKTSEHLEQENEEYAISQALLDALLFSSPMPKQLEAKGMHYVLVAAAVQSGTIAAAGFSPEEIDLVRYAAQNVIQYLEVEIPNRQLKNPQQPQQFMILFENTSANRLQAQVATAMQKICHEIKNNIKIELHVGISGVHSSIDSQLYQQAYTALAQRMVLPRHSIFLYSGNTCEENLEPEQIEAIQHFIKTLQLDELQQYLTSILKKFSGNNLVAKMGHIANTVSESLIRFYGFHMYEVADKFIVSVETISDAEDADALIYKIVNLTKNILTQKGISEQKEISAAQQVKNYIDNNYDKELSVRSLAEKFHVNYSYLSSLFAKEIGENISGYIIKTRVCKAQQLLSQTSDDINTIAQQVGYSDLQYFYRVFKKNTGTTPLGYRQKTKNVQ